MRKKKASVHEETGTSPVPTSPVPAEPKSAPLSLSFPDAMRAVINGKKVRRTEWVDREEYCLMRESYLMIHRNGKFHGWLISDGDMMAVDWEVVA
jgi:hypothetical protein